MDWGLYLCGQLVTEGETETAVIVTATLSVRTLSPSDL